MTQSNIELKEIYEDCTKVYQILREKLPNTCIIAAQIENRFYRSSGSYHNSPSSDQFDYLRRYFNRFLKNKNFKDCVLQVQGPDRLDDQKFYRDEVHLNSEGLSRYFNIIRNTLSYAYTKKFVNNL